MADGIEPKLLRPLPVPDQRSEGFWAAAAQHVLALQKCDVCGRFAHPPAIVCPRCLSTDGTFTFTPLAPRGRLRTWTVMRDAFIPAFRPDVPWAIGDAEIDDTGGARLIARLADGPTADYAVGAPVEIRFDDVAPGLALPVLRMVPR